MAAEDNKATLLRFVSELNKGNLGIIDDLCSPTFSFYSPSKPDWPLGLERARKMITIAVVAIPDLHSTIQDIFAEGDKVAVRCTFRGNIRGKHCPAIQNPGNVSLREPSVFIASPTAGSRKAGASESSGRLQCAGGDNANQFAPLFVHWIENDQRTLSGAKRFRAPRMRIHEPPSNRRGRNSFLTPWAR
jgi:SnoaL-like polyketide cyclase